MSDLFAISGVVVPFGCAGLIVLLGGRWRRVSPVLALVATLTVLAEGVWGLLSTGLHSEAVFPYRSALAGGGSVEWFSVGDSVLRLGWSVDSLASMMSVVVGVVASCVVVFSVGYLAKEQAWRRYFASVSLFTGAMTLVVVADSLVTLFVGWELVGACSYLLIGFWFDRPPAAKAAVKAFLTTRVGDVGLLVALIALWKGAGALDLPSVLGAVPTMPATLVSVAAVGIAVGAMGKSAQFPLHAWLPDAMEGPTPASALIHAATMVASGVYLVARLWPLFEQSDLARLVLMTCGVISAFGAALIAIAQSDIKKVLAYSTVSQLGFMFCALGAGAWGAAFFHLVTHAAFKALLFLSAGSVIHGSGTQDLKGMGGLRRSMPVTFAVWMTGAAALAGIPPLAGFFSKDAMLEAVWHAAPGVGVVLFVCSGLTALYMARATRMAFFGPAAEGMHAHESGLSMLVPMSVLAAISAGVGFAAHAIAQGLALEAEPLALGISLAATSCALLGGLVGWASVSLDTSSYVDLSRWAARGFGWDGLVDRVVIAPVVAACRVIWAVGDRFATDGLVEGVGQVARGASRVVGDAHSGDLGRYVAVAVAFAALVLLFVARVGV